MGQDRTGWGQKPQIYYPAGLFFCFREARTPGRLPVQRKNSYRSGMKGSQTDKRPCLQPAQFQPPQRGPKESRGPLQSVWPQTLHNILTWLLLTSLWEELAAPSLEKVPVFSVQRLELSKVQCHGQMVLSSRSWGALTTSLSWKPTVALSHRGKHRPQSPRRTGLARLRPSRI